MPCVILIHAKKTPKVTQFASECIKIMNLKGYSMVSSRNTEPTIFYNPLQTIAPAEITSTLKMVKAIQSYSQVVQKVIHSSTFKNG